MEKKRLKGHKNWALGPPRASLLFEPFSELDQIVRTCYKRDNSSKLQPLLPMTVEKSCVMMKCLHKLGL
jgi:ABC-type uncharacterized transport system YnjBCD ATPase subunit